MWNYFYTLYYIYRVLNRYMCYVFKVEIGDVYIFVILFNYCKKENKNISELGYRYATTVSFKVTYVV
jgi:hypothetical protein